MHTVIRNYTGGKALADELLKRTQDIERLISNVPGFVAYYLIKTSDGLATVTVCNDAAGCDESTKRAADFIREQVPNVRVASPQVISGDLAFRFANYPSHV